MPAVAAMLGIGVAWASRSIAGARPRLAAQGTPGRADRGARGNGVLRRAAAVRAPGRAGGSRSRARSARSRSRRSRAWPARVRRRSRATLLAGATLALTLVAVLALPLSVDVTAIENSVTDAGYVGALPGEEQRLVSAYLRAHQGGARYELAAESATQIGSLIVQDARPVVILTTYDARVFTSVAEAAAADRRREGALRVPEHVLRQARLDDNAACSATRQVGARARHRRLASRPGLSRGRSAVAAAGSEAVSATPAPDPPDLTEIARAARESGRIALDTEFMGEGRYRTLLCLIQLAVPDGAATRADRARRPARRGSGRRAAGGRARRSAGPGGGARRAPGHRARAPAPAHRGAQRVRHAGRGGLRGAWRRRPPTTRCWPSCWACGSPRARASPAGTRDRCRPSSWRTRARTSCTCWSWRRELERRLAALGPPGVGARGVRAAAAGSATSATWRRCSRACRGCAG